MRDIVKVIDRIKREVPDGHGGRTLRTRLEAIRRSAIYHPPECMAQNWGALSWILASELGEPDEPWKKTVAGIMSGEIAVEGGPT